MRKQDAVSMDQDAEQASYACARQTGLYGHSGKMTAHASNRLRDFRARRNGRHRNKLRQNGGNLEIPASVLFLPRLRSSQIC